MCPRLTATSSEPIATYRVQLGKEFTLQDAAAIVPYLAQLGISHIYTSPCQQTTAGSASVSDRNQLHSGRVKPA